MMNPSRLPVAHSAPYHDALAQCIEHWGLVPESTELIRDGVNHVFGAETEAGDRVIVRIGDGSIREPGEVEGELIWLDHLIQHGCVVTIPIRSRNGEFLESIELDAGVFHVCCFKRFNGRQIDPSTDPLWNDQLFWKLGREIGRIHRVSDGFHLPAGQDRKPWYECNLSQIPDPLPAGFDPQLRDPMQEFTDEMRRRPMKPRHYGLVHRDVHAGNILVENGEVQIIDFDLGCYGWRVMDFAVLLFSQYLLPSLRVPDASAERTGHVLASLVRGYREEYQIDREQFEMLDDILKLREIIFYVVASPAIEHWQIAMGNPQPSVAESLKWIENRWINGETYEVDLSQI